MIGFYFSLCTLIIMIIFTIFFFSKKKINNKETNIYGWLLIASVIMTLLEIITAIWFNLGLDIDTVAYKLLAKTVPICYVVLNSLFCRYLISICKKEKAKYKILNISLALTIILILILPIKFINNGNDIFPSGLAIYVAFLFCLADIFYQMYLCIKYRKLIAIHKFTPFYSFMLLGIINFAIMIVFPSAFLIGYIFCLTIIIMYFTIENPDLQMLREIHEAREYTEDLNYEKTKFLFNMVSEVKAPILNINRISKNALMEDDVETIKEDISEIKYSSNNLIEIVDGILDINNLEKRKIVTRENRYNPESLFKGIVALNKDKIKEPVEFRTSFDKTMPPYLYGDSIRIRQVLNVVLNEAIKNTKEGFIEFNMNSIIKHDNCRLIMTIEDTSKGYTKNELENMFEVKIEKDIEKIDEKEISIGLVKKILDLIGGAIVVNSEPERGTKYTVVVDQRILDENKSQIKKAVEQYEELYTNQKKVMIVATDEVKKKLKRGFKKYAFQVEEAVGGEECIRKSEKVAYDLIILEEPLEKLSTEDTLNYLKKIEGFKSPVIIIAKEITLNMTKEYQEKGFTDVYSLPINKEVIKDIVEKYIKK